MNSVLKKVHIGMISAGILWGNYEVFNEIHSPGDDAFSIALQTISSMIFGTVIGGMAGLAYPIVLPVVTFQKLKERHENRKSNKKD